MRGPVVVCAPNTFKGTLDAGRAAAAMARGVGDAGGVARERPVADGGDGTLDVLLAAAAHPRSRQHRVSGPLGLPVSARLGWLDATTAVVEMAEAAGLRLLRPAQRDALAASSRGAGELITAALDGGARRIIVGVGGSASTDGGTGLLSALGIRFLDARGVDLPHGGGALLGLAAIDVTGLDGRLRGCRVEVAVDVDNPLCGAQGAAAVYGPQKGAAPADVERLDAGLRRLAEVASRDVGTGDPGAPGSGAAGGCGFGLSLVGASLVPGASLICDLVGLDGVLRGADLVLTGEGRLDLQTAHGKAPAEVARRAAAANVPCAAIAGAVDAVPAGFARALSLSELGPDPQRHVRAYLRRAARLALR